MPPGGPLRRVPATARSQWSSRSRRSPGVSGRQARRARPMTTATPTTRPGPTTHGGSLRRTGRDAGGGALATTWTQHDQATTIRRPFRPSKSAFVASRSVEPTTTASASSSVPSYERFHVRSRQSPRRGGLGRAEAFVGVGHDRPFEIADALGSRLSRSRRTRERPAPSAPRRAARRRSRQCPRSATSSRRSPDTAHR